MPTKISDECKTYTIYDKNERDEWFTATRNAKTGRVCIPEGRPVTREMAQRISEATEKTVTRNDLGHDRVDIDFSTK